MSRWGVPVPDDTPLRRLSVWYGVALKEYNEEQKQLEARR